MKRVVRRVGAATAVTTLGLVALAPAAFAVNGPLANGGFESLPAGADTQTVTTANASTFLAPWTIRSGDVDLVRDTYWQAYEGHQSVDLAGTTPGAITQTIATTPGHTYTLAFAYTANPDGGPGTKRFRAAVTDGGSLDLFPTASGVTRQNMQWKTTSLTFTTTRTSVNIVFTDLDDVGVPYGAVVDAVTVTDVTVTAALPEAKAPAALALAGVVAIGAVMVGRRRFGQR